MVSNNAAEFSSGFRLRVISVLGSDECAPRTARSTSSGALLLESEDHPLETERNGVFHSVADGTFTSKVMDRTQ